MRQRPVINAGCKWPLGLIVGIATIVSFAGFMDARAETTTPSPSTNADRPIKDKWALVIGIGNFADKSLSLRYAAKDALDFRNHLVNDGNFASDHVHLLVNESATRNRILSELGDRWLPHVAGPDDLVVIYVSTHGSPESLDVERINYLLAYDTEPNSLYATGIALQDLVTVVKRRVHSDRILLVLDACHSGAAGVESKDIRRANNVDAQAIALGTGQVVITSSKPNQSSWESKRGDNSVFTRHLIASLKHKGPDTTLGAAFEVLKDRVQTEVLQDRGLLQTPDLKSRWQGKDLKLAVRPSDPRPAPPVAVDESPRVDQPPKESTKGEARPNPLLVTPPIKLLTGGLADVEVLMANKNYASAEKKLRTLLAGDHDASEKVCLLYVAGDIASEQKRFKDAGTFYEEALKIGKENLGPTHPYVAQALDRMVNLYWNQSKFAEAEKWLEQLITVMEKLMGDDQAVADKLSLLQFFFEQEGKTTQAAETERKMIFMKARMLR